MNWTGHIIAGGRSDLAELLRREEVKRTGVYLLVGEDPDDPDAALLYVGEGDDVGERLRSHNKPEDKGGKDFWNRAVVMTSKDANLTKAHARYLESRFISIAAKAGRMRVVNGTAPPPLPLPEADVSDMEYFIDQAKIILPVLGVDALRTLPTAIEAASASKSGSGSSPLFEMTIASAGILAKAQETDGEFAVLQGSMARAQWVGVSHGYSKLHEKLINDGVLVVNGPTAIFSKAHVFKSPSAAAAVISGRATNGRTTWRERGAGLTYAEWQERAAGAVGTEEAAPSGAEDTLFADMDTGVVGPFRAL